MWEEGWEVETATRRGEGWWAEARSGDGKMMWEERSEGKDEKKEEERGEYEVEHEIWGREREITSGRGETNWGGGRGGEDRDESWRKKDRYRKRG